jgi:hypothetical protein
MLYKIKLADETYFTPRTLTEKEMLPTLMTMTAQQREGAEVEITEEPKDVKPEELENETKTLDVFLRDMVSTANDALRTKVRELKGLASTLEGMMEKVVELSRDAAYIDVTVSALSAIAARVTKMGPAVAKAIEAGKELATLNELYTEDEE